MIALDTDRFEYELRRRGLEAKDLARLSGVHEVTISRIRTGHRLGSVRTLRRLYDTLAEVPVRKDLDRALKPPGAVPEVAKV